MFPTSLVLVYLQETFLLLTFINFHDINLQYFSVTMWVFVGFLLPWRYLWTCCVSFNKLIIQSAQQYSYQYNVRFKMLYVINENACVLWYILTGQSFHSPAFSSRMDYHTVGKIVDQISDVLWSKLSLKHLTVPDHDRFLDIAVNTLLLGHIEWRDCSPMHCWWVTSFYIFLHDVLHMHLSAGLAHFLLQRYRQLVAGCLGLNLQINRLVMTPLYLEL